MTKKELIIESAIKLYRAKGLTFTMDDITQDLHIAKKTIYRFFSSKEELLKGIVKYGFEHIQENKKKILAEDIPYLDKLKKLLIAMPTDIESINFKNLEPLEKDYPAVFELISKHLKSDWEPVYEYIQKGIDEGLLREVPLYMIEIIVSSSMNSLLSSDDKHSYLQSLDDLVDILMKGIVK